MNISDAIRRYRLRNPTTQEDLEGRWRHVARFGDHVVVAGQYHMGAGLPGWFSAVYEFLDEDHSCEGMLGLAAVTDVEFEDEGHALAWGFNQTVGA